MRKLLLALLLLTVALSGCIDGEVNSPAEPETEGEDDLGDGTTSEP